MIIAIDNDLIGRQYAERRFTLQTVYNIYVDMTDISPALTPDNATDVSTRSSSILTESSSELAKEVTHLTVTEHITYVTSSTTVTYGVTEDISHEAETNTARNVTSHRTTQTHNTNSSSTYTTVTDLVTDVTSDPVTDVASRSLRNTTTKVHTSTIHTTPSLTTEASTQNHYVTSVTTAFTDLITGTQNHCDKSNNSIGIVTGVCGGIVLVVLVTSFVCVFRLRNKWRIKIQMERKKTDIWSMATFNNTIINDNFSDYQLASSAVGSNAFTIAKRKSSVFSDHSVQMFDQLSYDQSHTRYSDENDMIVRSNAILPQEFSADESTFRRNTFSAPDGFNISVNSLSGEQELTRSSDNIFSSRDRSSTFTAGKKYKVDRHILLSHEELVEPDGTADHLAASYTPSTHGYYMTEL